MLIKSLLTSEEFNNKELNERLRKVSQRIQTDNSLAKVAEIIEAFIEHKHKYIE
jgi:predicted DNA-binding protein